MDCTPAGDRREYPRVTELAAAAPREEHLLYLLMALVWLSVAAMAFVLPRINPAVKPWDIPGTEISVGWIALVFFVHDIIRWKMRRAGQRDRRLLRPTPATPVPPEPGSGPADDLPSS